MPQPYDLSRLYQLAQSPQGQKLFALLQQKEDLSQLLRQAQSGDMEQTRQKLSALLDSPEARQLLRELGGSL